MINEKKALPQLNKSAVELAAEGKSIRTAEIASLLDCQLRRDLGGITSFVNEMHNSSLMKHVQEIADQQKHFQTAIENTFRSSGLYELNRTMSEIAKPISELAKAARFAHSSSFKGFTQAIEGHQASLRAISETVKPMAISYQNMLRQVTEPLNSINTIANSFQSFAFEDITNQMRIMDRNSLFELVQALEKQRELDLTLDNSDFSIADIDADESTAISKEIRNAIEDPKEIHQLSLNARKVLIWLIIFFIWPTIHNLTINYAYDKFVNPQNPQEIDVKELAKQLKAEIGADFRSSYRLVKGDRLNLRVAPSVKATILGKLQNGQLIEILDKSHKSWLMVEVEVDGERLVGWVFRRYTQHLN